MRSKFPLAFVLTTNPCWQHILHVFSTRNLRDCLYDYHEQKEPSWWSKNKVIKIIPYEYIIRDDFYYFIIFVNRLYNIEHLIQWQIIIDVILTEFHSFMYRSLYTYIGLFCKKKSKDYAQCFKGKSIGLIYLLSCCQRGIKRHWIWGQLFSPTEEISIPTQWTHPLSRSPHMLTFPLVLCW